MLRFAPSPIRNMNINDLRIAIFNYIVSKQLNEDLVIRIEDYNKDENIEGKDKDILEILSLFSIEYKNTVYQSESLKYHQKLAMQLMGQKKAFACFCSEDKLKELENIAKEEGKPFNYDGFCEKLSDETVLNTNAPFKIRITRPSNNIKFIDELNGNLEYQPTDIDYFPILSQDKTPTYNYACAIDDMLMNISQVIRSEKHLNDTAKQIYIRDCFAYDKEINYAHIKDIENGDLSIKSLIDDGFLPSAIANYIVLLGNEVKNEIFTLEEAIEWFDIKNISKDSIIFDIEKLKSINVKHLEGFDEMRLSKILGFADNDIGKLAKLYLSEASTIKEIKSKLDLIFGEKIPCQGFETEFKAIKECLLKAPFIDSFEELEKYIITETKLEGDSLIKPLRTLLTNSVEGPSLNDIYPLIKNYLREIIKR